MKTLKVDEKWSIQYDPEFNDKPLRWLRYGEHNSFFDETNPARALFYALLDREEFIEKAFEAHPNLDLDMRLADE